MIKLKDLLNESSREIGGYYMMKQLKDLARDAKRSGEKKVAKALMYLHDRINQSSRDIDLNADDLNDLLKDPRGRKYAKDLPNWMIDSLFEGKINEKSVRRGSKITYVRQFAFGKKGKETASVVAIRGNDVLLDNGQQLDLRDIRFNKKKYKVESVNE
tara:strand:+ start:133 stop:606 length:474 start_codon:yes stop_codon:yes gene_type:complete